MIADMNARTPVPLRPDHAATEREERRAITRAVTAMSLAVLRQSSPQRVLADTWPTDDRAARALATLTRAAVPPLTTDAVPALATETVRFLRRLSPKSVALQLFDAALTVDLKGGIATVRIPDVGAVEPAKFVKEGEPAPAVQFTFGSGAVLGPTKKILILSAVSRELEQANPQSAATIIGRLLSTSAALGVDAAVFSDAAGDDATPPGLLHNVTPLAPTAGGGEVAMVGDVANLAAAIADARLDPASMVIVAAVKQATTLALLAGPRFTVPIYPTTALAAGTVAAFSTDGIASTAADEPVVETRKEAAYHFEDTTPKPVVDGTPANPTRELFQHDMIGIKCRAKLAWTLAAPGGAQVINGATW
jgi:hypothetical protein